MSLNRNLLIEAGAGTGKTTRLVKAVLQALFIRQIPLDEMVALTFTNKAASELKERVSHALADVLEATTLETLRKKPWWPEPEPTLPLSDLKKLAQEATGVMDRADISTIHSFAYALLKRFPLAAGIAPDSEIDDKGMIFDELFRREWPAWLAVELGDNAPREAQWLELLSRLALSDIETAARELSDFKVPLEKLPLSDSDLPKKLKILHVRIRELSGAHPGDLKADWIARASEEIIGAAAHGAWEKLEKLSPEAEEFLEKDPGSPTKTWNEADLAQLEMFQAVALNLRARGDRVIALLTELLKPFATHFRQTLLSEGCLTHSALLFLSREIVKTRPEIRTALKRDIRLVLIDEFQDTDPLQAELLIYIAEQAGAHANDWEIVQLGEGKLFIVGDPKQSIYRFRGADIAAYERIGKLLVQQGGLQETLETNYRSQAQIIQIVNHAFERIIQPVPDISPPYISVRPHHDRDPERPIQDVQIWLADAPEKQTAEEAQATEAEHIARWIKEAQGDLKIFDPREGLRPLLYRDFALIFRSYSPMDRYIEALRRYDIPFAVESERYFFTTPEVTDFINLLRAADNPDDILSLVGFLRSPLSGLPDDEILKRKNAGTLEETESVRWLRRLTERLGRQPLADVLQSIFEESFLMEFAARSYHGDQTVANLLKLRRLLEGFASEGVTTMGLLLEKLEEFFADDKIEGENPLADEAYNAVRLLTIHKAKGLEYPVVFLPSLHSEVRAHASDPFAFDWRTQTLGLQVRDNSNVSLSNLDKIELDAQTRAREAAEENRILYVAMTRARERLVLSGGINLKANRSRTHLQKLMGAWGQSLGDLAEGQLQIGETHLTVRRLDKASVQDSPAKPASENALGRVDVDAFASIWKKRSAQAEALRNKKNVVTPTGERSTPNGQWISNKQGDDTDLSYRIAAPTITSKGPLILGSLIHRFLEAWDFNCEKCSMPAQLRHVANRYFAELGLLAAEWEETVLEAQKMLANFIGSESEKKIRASQIIGREVPFFYRTTEGAVMRGYMDILYRTPEGQLIVGDYKTDKEQDDQRYAAQAAAYTEAVSRAIGEKAAFQTIYLRAKVHETL